MNTPGHRWTAVAAVLAAATVTHPAPVHVTVAALTAWATGGGVLSPDVDNQPAWKALDRWLPDEWLGNGGPLQHRGITHSWMIPAGAYLAWRLGYLPAHGVVLAALAGVWLAWVSHLLADCLFGASYPMVGRPAGVPLFLWWGHVGTGLSCTGVTARLAGMAAPAAAVWLALCFTLNRSPIPGGTPW